MAERIERVVPRVALVLNESVQAGYSGRFAFFRHVIDGSREWSDMGEAQCGKKIPHFDLRMDALLHAPVDL